MWSHEGAIDIVQVRGDADWMEMVAKGFKMYLGGKINNPRLWVEWKL